VSLAGCVAWWRGCDACHRRRGGGVGCGRRGRGVGERRRVGGSSAGRGRRRTRGGWSWARRATGHDLRQFDHDLDAREVGVQGAARRLEARGQGRGRRGRCRCGLGGGRREGDHAGVEDVAVHDAAAHACPGAAGGDGERPCTGRSRATTRFQREVWQRRRDFRSRGGDDSWLDWGGREGRTFHQRRAGMGEECLRRCAIVGARYVGGGGALRQQGGTQRCEIGRVEPRRRGETMCGHLQ
jgi:hypothetical protein